MFVKPDNQPYRPPMKTVVAIAFVLIIGSLASALFFLMRDKGRSNRTVQALAMRVGLSITLFLLVLFSYKMGWIQPTGLR
jgi:branched-subunit amino acid transport protein AzlD